MGKASGQASLIDLLDRILDNSIVIDAELRVRLPVLDLVPPDVCLVVTATEMLLDYVSEDYLKSLYLSFLKVYDSGTA